MSTKTRTKGGERLQGRASPGSVTHQPWVPYSMLELVLPVCSKMNSFEAPKKFFAELPDDQSGQVTAGLFLGVLHKTRTCCAVNVSHGFWCRMEALASLSVLWTVKINTDSAG